MLLFLFGCIDTEPSFVSTRDLDKALGTGDTSSLCAGLRMEDPKTREDAASKLKVYGLDTPCLCERLKYEDRWDLAILQGLAEAKDAEKVGCVTTLLDDPAAPDRPGLAQALLQIPVAEGRVRVAATSDADPAVRVAAMAVFRNTKDAAERTQLEAWLGDDPSPQIRAAAAAVLFDQPASADALVSAVRDAEPEVRSAAITTLQSVRPPNLAELLCDALMNDPVPDVRMAALASMRATRDPAQLACLEKRALAEESSPEVRALLLKTLQSSAAPEAAATLCTIVPSWVRMYVREELPEEADDVLKAQNNRDFEKSYECAASASKQSGGYTCIGRMYVNTFYRDVGGKVGVSNCGGGAPHAASNEIVF